MENKLNELKQVCENYGYDYNHILTTIQYMVRGGMTELEAIEECIEEMKFQYENDNN